MNRLFELRKPIDEMTHDELREHIRRMRHERRINRERPSTKRAKKIKSNKSASKVVNMMHTLTPEQVRLLLGEIDESSPNSSGENPGKGQSQE